MMLMLGAGALRAVIGALVGFGMHWAPTELSPTVQKAVETCLRKLGTADSEVLAADIVTTGDIVDFIQSRGIDGCPRFEVLDRLTYQGFFFATLRMSESQRPGEAVNFVNAFVVDLRTRMCYVCLEQP